MAVVKQKHKCPFAKIVDYSVRLAKCKFGGYCPDSVYIELYNICPQYQRMEPGSEGIDRMDRDCRSDLLGLAVLTGNV